MTKRTYSESYFSDKQFMLSLEAGPQTRSFKAKLSVRARLKKAVDDARARYDKYCANLANECPHPHESQYVEEYIYEDDWSKQGTTNRYYKCSVCGKTLHSQETHHSW